MKQLAIHPLAELFPPMSAAELQDLTESIAERGVQHPIITYEGKILDGRHRDKACRLAGVKPIYEQYKGSDPLGFVISINLHRRHLDTAQRSIIAARIADLKHGEGAGKWLPNQEPQRLSKGANLRSSKAGDSEPDSMTHAEAAELMNVSERSVDTASKILDEAPKSVIKAVEQGEISLNAAKTQLEEAAAEDETPAVVNDATGYRIPEPLHELWARREEITALMRQLTGMRTLVLKARDEKDPLWKTLNFSDMITTLENAHQELRSVQLHAVCTTCQGRNPSRCAFCKGRGFLSKYLYNSAVPAEIKAMRNKQ